jgi:Na+-transporting methylmalonyl-CoA/oxaloacetate decarboxylase gamma subunit
VALYKDAKSVAKDVTAITMEISGHIGKFFDAHEQVKTAAAEQKKNPPKGKSLKAQALDNIFQEMELERQATELRELLIYGVDPALGAVWSRFQDEFERLQAEQEKERLAQEAKERVVAWQRRKMLNQLQDRALIIAGVAIVFIYLHLMFLAIRQMRIAKWGF